MKPIIPWIGGKRRWLPVIGALLPEEIENYYEPFAGSIAVYLYLRKSIKGKVYISDTNYRLVNMYNQLQLDPKEVHNCLVPHYQVEDHKAHFFEVRDRLGKYGPEAAADFMYLVQNCFNGHWKENKNGDCIVQPSSKPRITIPTVEAFQEFSEALELCQIYYCPFETLLEQGVMDGDFVYLDPPYINRTFEYTSDKFPMELQEYIKDFAEDNDANVMISNALNVHSLRLYQSEALDVYQVTPQHRAMVSKHQKRDTNREIIVTNYRPNFEREGWQYVLPNLNEVFQ